MHFLCSFEAIDHKVPLTHCQHNQLEQGIQYNYPSSKVRQRENQALSKASSLPFNKEARGDIR